MTDSVGKKILDGNLMVKDYLDDKISGTYEFTNVYQKDFVALGVMDGTFDGNVLPNDSNKVFINFFTNIMYSPILPINKNNSWTIISFINIHII